MKTQVSGVLIRQFLQPGAAKIHRKGDANMATDTTSAKSWIQRSPDVCGGDACVRNTRITVHGLVQWRKLGLSDARILEIIEGLTGGDLAAAWEYYRLHQAEIDEEIRLNEEA